MSPEDIGEAGNFEITVDHGDGTETVVDPLVGTYDQSISPWSTQPPDVFEVDLKLQVGVTSMVRHTDQWRKTDTYTSTFYLDTSTYKYFDDIPNFSQQIWDFAYSENQRGAQIKLHAAVWLDNPTHPPVATGVVRLPKGHRDVSYTQAEFVSASWLQERLNNIASDLKNSARY